MLEHTQVGCDGLQDRGRQAAGAGVTLGVFGDVVAAQRDRGREPGGGLAGPGHAQDVQVVEEPERPAGEPEPGAEGHLPGAFQVCQPVGERDDVGPAQHARIVAVVAAGQAQALRQRCQGVDRVPGRVGGPLAPAQRQVFGGPSLGRLPQPLLGKAGEVQRAGQPEHRQLPHVLGLLALGV